MLGSGPLALRNIHRALAQKPEVAMVATEAVSVTPEFPERAKTKPNSQRLAFSQQVSIELTVMASASRSEFSMSSKNERGRSQQAPSWQALITTL